MQKSESVFWGLAGVAAVYIAFHFAASLHVSAQASKPPSQAVAAQPSGQAMGCMANGGGCGCAGMMKKQ
jgi:hypothetical protein